MLLSIDTTLAALAEEAGARGYALLVSGRVVIGAEYHRGEIIWYADDIRCSYAQAQQALENARAARRASSSQQA